MGLHALPALQRYAKYLELPESNAAATVTLMAYRFASEAGQVLGQSERVALQIQAMLKPTTREVRWVREFLNLPAFLEAGPS